MLFQLFCRTRFRLFYFIFLNFFFLTEYIPPQPRFPPQGQPFLQMQPAMAQAVKPITVGAVVGRNFDVGQFFVFVSPMKGVMIFV